MPELGEHASPAPPPAPRLDRPLMPWTPPRGGTPIVRLLIARRTGAGAVRYTANRGCVETHEAAPLREAKRATTAAAVDEVAKTAAVWQMRPRAIRTPLSTAERAYAACGRSAGS